MKKFFTFIFLPFFLLPSIFFSAVHKIQTIKPIIEEMLSHHVDHREYTPMIAARSLKIYLHTFDPEGIYFLTNEVSPYLNPTNVDLAQMVQEFYSSTFHHYFQLNKDVVHAIHRARKMRACIKTELLKKKNLEGSFSLQIQEPFTRTHDQLYQLLYTKMQNALIEHAKEKGLSDLDVEEKMKVLQFYEKKARGHEETYLHLGERNKEEISLRILKAIAASLDAHSMYYGDQEAKEIKAHLHKEVCGVGICLSETTSGVSITYVVPCSSAGFLGQPQVGDILLEIDGEEISGLYFHEVLRKLEGKEHSKVLLTLKKPSGSMEKVSLSREKIVLEEDRIHVDYEHFGNGIIGKIVLPSFYDNNQGISLESDLKEAIRDLRSLGSLDGLVLDLRKNAGGFLHQAIKVAGLFSHQGVVVIAKYADDKIEYTRSPDPRFFYDGPIVILTSKASASAAEILAQSLKDEGLAVIVGDENTYGKGSMQYQTVTDPEATKFYKVTVGRYFTMSLQSTQIEGVKTDIHVPTEFAPFTIGEKYLRYALSHETIHAKATIQEELKNILYRYQFRKKTKYEKMLPILKENSAKRLSQDRNFQLFKASLTHKEEASPRQFGCSDLQMKEAVNILKDMIFLSHLS